MSMYSIGISLIGSVRSDMDKSDAGDDITDTSDRRKVSTKTILSFFMIIVLW